MKRCIPTAFPLAPRSALHEWAKDKGEDGIQNYWVKKNQTSLDIASFVLAHKLTLVTRNVQKFERIEGLRLENWYEDR